MVATEPMLVTYRRARKEGVGIHVHYVTDPAQIPEFLAWVQTLEKPLLLVDIETDGSTRDGLDWHSKKIATLQVGNPLCKDPRAWVFCLRSLSEESLQPIFALFENPAYKKMGQNIRFELVWLLNKYGVRFENLYDTQIAELVLRAGLFPISKTAESDGQNRKAYGETSMAALARRYLELQIEKGDHVRLRFWSTPAGELNADQLRYAAGDVVYPAFIAQEQKREIIDRGLSSIIGIEMDLIPVLADSEHAGLGMDTDAWQHLYVKALADMDRAKRDLDELLLPVSVQSDLFGAGKVQPTVPTLTQGGRVIEANYNAPSQMQRLFVRYLEHVQWPVRPVTRFADLVHLKRLKGQKWLENHPNKKDEDIPDWVLSEDEYVVMLNMDSKQLRIARARKQLPHNLVDAYLRYKDAAKRVTSYGLKFLDAVDHRTNRIHVNWNQAITTTGRMSAEPGVQTIPRTKEYRSCFMPKRGWKFCIRDYSQIEPRLSAEVSGDPLYRSIFNNGEDIYVRIGEEQTKQKIDKKTEQGKIMRQGSKTTVLATAYNMGARKLRDNLTLNLEAFILDKKIEPPSFEMAAIQLRSFFEVAPKIKEYQDRCIAHADPDTGPKIYDRYVNDEVTYVTAPCGRKRFFRSDAKNVYTEAPNAPIQGCVHGDTRLLTKETGYAKISDLVNQEITVWDGERFVHARVVSSGKKKQLRVRLVGGTEIVCSPNHKFLVITDYSTNTMQWRSAAELKPCHRVLLAAEAAGEWDAGFIPEQVELGKSCNANNRSLLEALMAEPERCGEVLGRLASDGSNSGRQLSWFVAEHEVNLLQPLKTVLQRFGFVSQDVDVRDNVSVKNERYSPLHRLTISAIRAARELHEIKYRIPAVAWRNSRVLAGYLRGMFDGDGSVTADGAVLTFGRGDEKRPWALEVQQALLLFGIQSRVRSYVNSRSDNGRTVVQVMKRDMSRFAERIGFMNPRKQAKAEAVTARRSRGRMGPAQLVQLVEILPEPVDMYDVLDSETSKFVANGMVTHNSSATITKLAAVLLWKRAKERNIPVHVVNYMHDEMIVETPDIWAPEVSVLLEQCMVEAGQRYIKSVPVLAEAAGTGIFDYWHKD